MTEVASAPSADQVHIEMASTGLNTEPETEINEVRLYSNDGLARSRSTNKSHA